MFDAGYSITCRDAALPVGKMYKLRDTAGASSRLAAARAGNVDCGAAHNEGVAGLGQIAVIDCKLKDVDVGYRVYQLSKGRQFYSAKDLSGYDSALQLGLRSLIADQPVKGEISIATTGSGDPAAFARVQAGTLDPAKALAEAYRRNNAGSYAEAAEFFAAVSNSGELRSAARRRLSNEALQKSNLGRYAEADALFARAAEQVGVDPIVARRLRNYRAIHLLNQGRCQGCAGRSSTSRCPSGPARMTWPRRRRQAGHRHRHRQAAECRIASSDSSSARNPTNCCPLKRPRSSTARRSSCAARRCA